MYVEKIEEAEIGQKYENEASRRVIVERPTAIAESVSKSA